MRKCLSDDIAGYTDHAVSDQIAYSNNEEHERIEVDLSLTLIWR